MVCAGTRTTLRQSCALAQEFMKAIMCFMVEFWDVNRQPQPPIKPHSEPYIDFEWPLQGWCIDLPQVSQTQSYSISELDHFLQAGKCNF